MFPCRSTTRNVEIERVLTFQPCALKALVRTSSSRLSSSRSSVKGRFDGAGTASASPGLARSFNPSLRNTSRMSVAAGPTAARIRLSLRWLLNVHVVVPMRSLGRSRSRLFACIRIVRGAPSAPMNRPASNRTSSRIECVSLPRFDVRSSGVRTRTEKSTRSASCTRLVRVFPLSPNTPWFQRLASQSLASSA